MIIITDENVHLLKLLKCGLSLDLHESHESIAFLQ